VFKIFKEVKIDFDFHSKDLDSGDAIICSNEVVPSPRFNTYAKTSLMEMLENEGAEGLLFILSQHRETPLTIYFGYRDYLFFLSMYLKSTLDVDDIFVLDTYYESLNRLDELDTTLLKPSEKFKKGVKEALAIDPTEAINIVSSAPVVDYLESEENLPFEILLAHWCSRGVALSGLPEDMSEMARIQLVMLHDALMMGGFISSELKPYVDVESFKRQETCEPGHCRCSGSLQVFKAKMGEIDISVDEYAKRN
jgi:hypothetical protein